MLHFPFSLLLMCLGKAVQDGSSTWTPAHPCRRLQSSGLLASQPRNDLAAIMGGEPADGGFSAFLSMALLFKQN